MENEFLKINKQCLSNLGNIKEALQSVETKGDSSVLIVKIRTVLEATLEQIQEDNNNKKEEGISLSEKKEKEG
jgi:hypothetical protein